ncbi:hypothetical protein [Niveibacterium terrae]|uniref:hypothetical protein n=1 Tax=Niveibacterium terrae TaxID=3373598 RepID=UPI003A925687
MDMDPDFAQTRSATLMAAALHLLSCSAAHGLSSAKAQALVKHLTALAERADTDPLLARTCEELAEVWQRLEAELEAHKREEAARLSAQLGFAPTPMLH